MFKLNYFSPSHLAAGFIAVMIGFTSSAVLVFQAATLAGATPAEISSWVFALGLGISIACIGLSLYYKTPVLIGWSTAGAAVLVTSLAGVPMSEAVGAFIMAGLLTVIVGVTGIFDKVMSRIPQALTAAMLAGILFNFGLNVFVAMGDQFSLVFSMLIVYLLGKRLFPRYAIMLVLLFGLILAKTQGLLHMDPMTLTFPSPIYTVPVFTLSTFLSVTVPLFMVTMTSQNIPGFAVLRTNNYHLPTSPIIICTGLLSLLLAPFGNYSICLAAITAAICASKDADYCPENRYKATIFAGICWFLIACFGGEVVAIFSAFPKDLVLALSGLALLSTISNSLKIALEEEKYREPALITILVSASGLTLFGIGSAFWGLVAGILASLLLHADKASFKKGKGPTLLEN